MEQADHAYRAVLRQLPFDAAIHNDHGAVLAALGRHADAVAAFSAACNLLPRFATAFSNLGGALMASRRMPEAVASLRMALDIDPTLAEAHANLGNALLELLHPKDALPHLDQALALDPILAEAHYARGQAKLLLGDLAEAQAAFSAAVALGPGEARFYDGLTTVRLLASDDPNVAAMEALVRVGKEPDRPGQIGLHFGLHRAYEHQGRYLDAIDHLIRGNALRRARIAYDERTTMEAMENVAAAFDAMAMRAAPARGPEPDVPIFIVGMPRSGSTLVEQIICSHHQVFGAGEVGFLGEELARIADGDLASLATDRATFEEVGQSYRTRLQALAPDARRITDKRLTNFLHLGLIRLALPSARVIHTMRDPADTCLSCFAQTFARSVPFSNDLGELGRYYRAYAKLMDHWRGVMEENFVCEIRYEELVGNFEPQVRRILDFCGLPWDPACLAFHVNQRPVLTASAAQVRQPLYGQSVGRARRYGTLLQPLYDALGEAVGLNSGSDIILGAPCKNSEL